MKIAIGSDHGGFDLKSQIIEALSKEGIFIKDMGTNSKDSVDYPIYGKAVGEVVASGECEYGIVICTTGIGISIAANKVKGIRCGIGFNDDAAKYMRLHNNANVISFGAKYTTLEEALNRIHIFISTDFEGGRHCRRVEML